MSGVSSHDMERIQYNDPMPHPFPGFCRGPVVLSFEVHDDSRFRAGKKMRDDETQPFPTPVGAKIAA